MSTITPYQAQALNIEKHISLVANAGSGKTFVLSKRFVEIFLKQDLLIEEIIAITFTDKAAKELYKKISQEINGRLSESSEDFEKLDQLRRQLPSANISTIHSFCSRVLKSFAPEAGIDVNFSLLTGSEMNELFELTVDEYISKNLVGTEISEDFKSLIRIIGAKDNLIGQIKKLFDKRDTMIRLSNELYNYDSQEIAEIIKDRFIHEFKSVFKSDLGELFSSIDGINNFVLSADSNNKYGLKISVILGKRNSDNFIEDLAILFEILESFVTKEGTIRKSGYLSKIKGFDFSSIDNLQTSIVDILDSKLNKESFALLQFSATYGLIVSKIVKCIFDLYQKKKRKKSLLDYEDLLLFTKELFAKEEVLSMLKEKYKFIMIDEYQDTNEIQYQIFVPLLDELKRGNLFVVGDEKQSIYMFRNADLSVFRKTNELIKSKNEQESILTLPHSFRLYPAIAAFTNLLFSRLFFNPNPEFNEVRYEPLICTKPIDDLGEIELLIEKKKEVEINIKEESENIESEENEQANQYELIALKILELINSEKDEINLSDIAILSRKRSAFEPIEAALIKHNISYQIVKGTGFYQKQVVYDLYNYFAFLLNQSDNIALLGILKSPFFNFSDLDFVKIVSYEGKNLFNKLINYSKDNNTIKSSVDKLKNSISKVNELSIHELMIEIILDSNYLSIVSSRKQSEQDLANINKLIQKSREYTSLGFKTIYDYVQFLKEAISKIDDEGQGEVELGKEKVNIMTIHSSKGLEFKAVFVVECESNFINSNDNRKGVIGISSVFGYMSHLPINSNYFQGFEKPPQLYLTDFIQKKKEIAEAKRLFYVAVTRAEKYLYLTATIKERKYETSFLGLLYKTFDLEGKECVDIKSKLEFMFKDEEEKFYTENHAISFSIPILNTIDEKKITKIEEVLEKKSLFIDDDISFNEYPKNEFYSATKIAVFSQCPVKYHLIYDLGFNKVNELFQKTDIQFDFKEKEDEEFMIPSDMRGRIIHKILEVNVAAENLREVIKTEIRNEFLEHPISISETLIDQIHSSVSKYYETPTYKQINSFSLFKNEYELYNRFDEDYLYGVIDKVVFDEKEKIIHIIDYKTDKLNSPKQAEEKFQNYLVQLFFYAFLLSKKYEEYKIFRLRIIFVEKPELEFVSEIGVIELNKFSNYLKGVINKIKSKKVVQDKSHCSKCHFYAKDKCIMDK
ncbi:MAG: UvrD-helicase domain-containing protein [Melioribacteraceae bacterium]